MNYKTILTVFVLDALHEKTGSSLIVSWGKALHKIPPFLCEKPGDGGRVVKQSIHRGDPSDKRLASTP